MIIYSGKKLTANQVAKEFVFEKGANAEYWFECDSIERHLLTEKETADIESRVQHHLTRTRKFLGI